jgi:hypothetical protein
LETFDRPNLEAKIMNTPSPMVPVNLPAELIAKLEELKHDRQEDRDKSVEQLVREFCESYVRVREKARWELAHMDEINRSYEEHPNDWEDADVWEAEYRRMEEEEQR